MSSSQNSLNTKKLGWAISVFIVLFFVVYFESVKVLIGFWAGTQETIYRNGFLVLGCTVYLLYHKREKFGAIKISPNIWAATALVICNLVWFIGLNIDVQTVHLSILPVILLSAVSLVLGNRALRLVFLPVTILLFAIPMWWPLIGYMQSMVTYVTELNLRIIGKPVFVEGYVLHLPGGSFVIDPGCAGLSFLLVTLIISFVCVDMFSLSTKKALILVSIGILSALAANFIRVLTVVLVGDYTNMQHSLVSNHYNLGWFIYGVMVLIPLFIINDYLSSQVEKQKNIETPVSTINDSDVPSFRLACSLTFSILLIAPLLNLASTRQISTSRDIVAPQAVEPWMLIDQVNSTGISDWEPNFVNSSRQRMSKYKRNGETVTIHIVNYDNQRQGAELINSLNSIADNLEWREIQEKRQPLVLGLGETKTISVISTELQSRSLNRKAVWYWYNVAGRLTIAPFEAKFFQILSIFSGRVDGSLFSLSIDCVSDCKDENIVLASFMRTVKPFPRDRY